MFIDFFIPSHVIYQVQDFLSHVLSQFQSNSNRFQVNSIFFFLALSHDVSTHLFFFWSFLMIFSTQIIFLVSLNQIISFLMISEQNYYF